jgi:hypothetical protein
MACKHVDRTQPRLHVARKSAEFRDNDPIERVLATIAQETLELGFLVSWRSVFCRPAVPFHHPAFAPNSIDDLLLLDDETATPSLLLVRADPGKCRESHVCIHVNLS